MELERFLSELDHITLVCAEIAQEYAQLKGAMVSLEGLKDQVPDEEYLKAPVIRFFNETKNLRIARIISVSWMLSEQANENRRAKSSLSSNAPKQSELNDNIPFSGDMTLMRMRDMFRVAIRKFPDLIETHVTRLLTRATQEEISEEVRHTIEKLDILLQRVDDHIQDKTAWQLLNHFRNTTNHSLKIPNSSIRQGWIDETPQFTYNQLYEYADRAASIAIEFRRMWSLSPVCSGLDEIQSNTQESYSQFWEDFFKNASFYDLPLR